MQFLVSFSAMGAFCFAAEGFRQSFARWPAVPQFRHVRVSRGSLKPLLDLPLPLPLPLPLDRMKSTSIGVGLLACEASKPDSSNASPRARCVSKSSSSAEKSCKTSTPARRNTSFTAGGAHRTTTAHFIVSLNFSPDPRSYSRTPCFHRLSWSRKFSLGVQFGFKSCASMAQYRPACRGSYSLVSACQQTKPAARG